MESWIEIDFVVDEIEVRYDRPFLSLYKNYDKTMQISGRGYVSYPFSIDIRGVVDLARSFGRVVLSRHVDFTKPKTDKNGDIVGYIRYNNQEAEPSRTEEPASQFLAEVFGFDSELWIAFAPTVRIGDRFLMSLGVYGAEHGSLPDSIRWTEFPEESLEGILVYGFRIKHQGPSEG